MARVITNDQIYDVLGSIDTSMRQSLTLMKAAHIPILEGFSNMAFQLGKTKLSKFVKTIEFIKNNNYMEASIEMLDSDWAEQAYNRANRISTLFQKVKKIYDPKDNHANAIDNTNPDYDARLDGLGMDERNPIYREEKIV